MRDAAKNGDQPVINQWRSSDKWKSWGQSSSSWHKNSWNSWWKDDAQTQGHQWQNTCDQQADAVCFRPATVPFNAFEVKNTATQEVFTYPTVSQAVFTEQAIGDIIQTQEEPTSMPPCQPPCPPPGVAPRPTRARSSTEEYVDSPRPSRAPTVPVMPDNQARYQATPFSKQRQSAFTEEERTILREQRRARAQARAVYWVQRIALLDREEQQESERQDIIAQSCLDSPSGTVSQGIYVQGHTDTA